MIELIFVIVIIGILAAVAIPKLAATRDDAKISNIIANTRTLVGDLGAYYTAQGTASWDQNGSIGDATNVDISLNDDCSGALDENTTIGGNTFYLCDGDVACVSFETGTDATAGELTVADEQGTTQVCQGVSDDPVIIGIVGKQDFGGSRVVR
jgi:type II secretory pathway pseudopilin PulG